MFALIRTLVYASLFIGTFLLFFPAQILGWSGITRPETGGVLAWLGVAIGACGAAIAVWCVLTFGTIGRGTPAPFDPPRRLVTRGPYRVVRNPMYLGAGLALLGAALFYGDAMITPAISVLSAIEGVQVVAPDFDRWILPATIVVIIGLFAVQRFGTGGVATVFGPITAVWFLALGGFIVLFSIISLAGFRKQLS